MKLIIYDAFPRNDIFVQGSHAMAAVIRGKGGSARGGYRWRHPGAPRPPL